jgi:hypothetical protein
MIYNDEQTRQRLSVLEVKDLIKGYYEKLMANDEFLDERINSKNEGLYVFGNFFDPAEVVKKLAPDMYRVIRQEQIDEMTEEAFQSSNKHVFLAIGVDVHGLEQERD